MGSRHVYQARLCFDNGNDRIRFPVAAKIAAMGVRVKRWVTMHGLAINVTTNLAHFQTIIPCGLADRGVTSLHELLGDRTPSMEAVKMELTTVMRRRIAEMAAEKA